ncbi:MAG: hypothetical protein HQM02_10895, partial [Magnetococcales bacterium]|nr:hypothetical protein [Magnetococcales bacterium]
MISRYRSFALFFLLLLTAVGIRLWLLMEPVNSDPMGYFSNALGGLLQADFRPQPHHQAFRLPLLAVIRFFGLMGGYSLQSYYLATFFNAMFCFVALALFVTRFSGLSAAFMVAALWTTSYVALESDAMLLTENLGVALLLLGLTLVRQAGVTTRTAPAWGLLPLLGGFFLWAACSVRESLILFIPLAVLLA